MARIRLIVVLWMMAFGVAAGGKTKPADASPVGRRPYEMEWAGRVNDDRPALVDFENLDGWTVEPSHAIATFGASREQQLWGKFVGKLTYRATDGDAKSPAMVDIRPPSPITLPAGAECLNLWVYGNRLGWVRDPKDPPAHVGLLLGNKAGKERHVPLHAIDWKEWHLLHLKFSAEQLAFLADGGCVRGIRVMTGDIRADHMLYFDNLSAYKETLKPLTFEPRPKRNLTLFEGQSPGLNTGPGVLPFPTREETILPDNLAGHAKVELTQDGTVWVFTYRGDDGALEYRYLPKAGDFSDITAHWGDVRFQPMAEGGIRFAVEGNADGSPKERQLLSVERDGDALKARWRRGLNQRRIDVTYVLRLWKKSLVIDVIAPGGQVGEVRFGKAAGVTGAKQIPIPFLNFRQAQRPLALMFGKATQTLFLFAHADWYRSNASELFNASRTGNDWCEYNGGAHYLPKTDGVRNDCFERFFLTISPRFEETLPNIPNPRSPWMKEMADGIWIAHAATDRSRDYAAFATYARHGMTHIIITDHETGWRDGCESFTFRTRTAPGRGGDDSQREYALKLHALGFRYGIYNNYTDFAPVNGFWDEDMVARRSNGQWLPAWYRCYTPKPARAVEYEARLAPQIQEKFKLSTAYCDVHTAIPPWSKEDYDARVSGAGTFTGTFYAYGEIMLHQKKTWNGPVYSEGGSHWMYSGLTDGNYGQDTPADLPNNPWLVDFDLLKMHPLGSTFGMGNVQMFFGERANLFKDHAAADANLDLFLSATVAFGHTGFLVRDGGLGRAARSYFMLQGIQRQYAPVKVARIQYADDDGKLLDTSAALATGVYTKRRIRTEYENGFVTVVNGHPSANWTCEIAGRQYVLPPSGYVGRYLRADAGKPVVEAISILHEGHRIDWATCAEYSFLDGRGKFTRFENMAADGAAIALPRPGGKVELIPLPGCKQFGIASATGAAALDESGKTIGPADVRQADGLGYPQPVKGAFSYLVEMKH